MEEAFLTGATGFVGSHLLDFLLRQGYRVTVLVRPGSEDKLDIPAGLEERVEIFNGDILNPASLEGALNGADKLIHLVGIIEENSKQGITFRNIHVKGIENILQEAKRADIEKIVHMSALGAEAKTDNAYHRTKYLAEKRVRESGIPYTIFRPSIIFGVGSEFIDMLSKLIKLPIIPVIGSGEYKLQPVSVKTVCQVFTQALSNQDTTNQTYEVGGPEILSYNQILDTMAEVMNYSSFKLNQPLWLMRPLIKLTGDLSFVPITPEQLDMLLKGNVCNDPEQLYKVFDITEIYFKDWLN